MRRPTASSRCILTTGRILSQYNVGAQTRRTANVEWHPADLLEIHEADAAERGINDGDWVAMSSRVGETHMRAHISDRVPQGVVYTTFHHPESGANVVTTEYSDWATNCPEYKVTAVQLRPANADRPRARGGSEHECCRSRADGQPDRGQPEPPAGRRGVQGRGRRTSQLFWTPTMRRDLAEAVATAALS